MLDRWFGPKTHHYLHFLGMVVLAFGLPFNKVLMSIGAIWGASNLLLEGKFKTYFENFKKNKAFLFLLGLFVLHIIGLIWTNNFEYAFHDLRIKLPLLVIPVALVAHPIAIKKEVNMLLQTFLVSVLIISLYNGYSYLQMSDLEIGKDFREISNFGSHIRFSILVVIGFVLSTYFFITYKKWWRVFFLILAIWLLFYTYYSQVMSGPLSLIAVFVFFLIYKIWHKKILRYSLITFCIATFGVAVVSVKEVNNHKSFDYSKLAVMTQYGNFYYHDTLNPIFENNKPIYIYIAYDELADDWLKHFSIERDGKDKKGNLIEATFLRYMTSKDLRKDRDGMNLLSAQDIQNIENGIATPDHLQKGFKGRFAALKYALENRNNPNNSTILQRIEYWKTADQIIMNNPIIGIGTGDVRDEFSKQYVASNSKLVPSKRLRAHNQFLTIQLTFGIFGTLLLLFFMGHFLQFNRSINNLLAFCLFGAIIASFLVEDTLETQTGVTLFSFFIGLCLVQWKKPEIPAND